MIDQIKAVPLLIMMAGAMLVLAILIKSAFERILVPPLIGYIGLGFAFRVADLRWEFLTEAAMGGLEFLASLGVITLLFRVGLESELPGLVRQFPRACVIWIANMLLSGILGYLAAYHVLDLELIPSLFIGTALSATSVGISVAVWREANAIKSPLGELLIDAAELDDITAVAIMAFLFAIAPVFRVGAEAPILSLLGKTAILFFLKLIAFGAFCILFSFHAERPMTRFFMKIKPAPDPMLLVAGIGFMVAALAELLGFSVAIGAMFAGLVFSRDPEAVKMDASFSTLYELFAPFFFIGIGLHLDPGSLSTALGVGAVLVVAAVFGKVIGAGGPALLMTGWTGAGLIGISMVPRAEIAMIIMQQGSKLGDWAVPPQVFAGMVLVSAVTCIVTPFIVFLMLRRWPQEAEKHN